MATATLPVPVQAPTGKRSFYRPELDVLRFFAFLAVFLFHFNHPMEFYVQHGIPRSIALAATSLIEGGVFGVDLFFVLSAYLITELLFREKDLCGSLDVKGFYMRRILRIWPLYFFYIGLALIPAFNPDHVFTWRHAVAYLLLAGNWSVIAWGWPLHSIIGPLWTVSIEEQFYLLWPPIVRNLSRHRLAAAAVAMLVISNITRIVMIAIHGGMNSVWCNTLGRLDPIAAGILVAAVLRGGVPNFKLGTRLGMLIAGILPLALVANYWKIHEPEHLDWIPTLAGFPLVAVSCTLIMLAVLGVKLRMPQSLLYLGKISYGLYVYHALGNVLSNKLIPVHTAFIQLALRPIAALGITLVLAAISYAVLESPFLKLKKRFAHVESRPV
ncbi:MAG TPA: acyltransferase [Terriglobales bacterium]|nr:acyltransferase [Terriglobales bacterium]